MSNPPPIIIQLGLRSWRQMRWSNVLSVDILFSIGLLSILIGIAVACGAGSPIHKAQMSKVYTPFDENKLLLEEQFALTGDGMPIAQVRTPRQQAASTSNDDEIEAALSYKVSRSTAATADASEIAEYDPSGLGKRLQGGADKLGGLFSGIGKPGDSGNDVVQSVSKIDNSLVINVKLDRSGKQYFIAFTPAVIESDIPGSIIWLCGNRQPPQGWVSLPGVSGTNLPDEYLVNTCRNSKEY